jgi:hypothetical protein
MNFATFFFKTTKETQGSGKHPIFKRTLFSIRVNLLPVSATRQQHWSQMCFATFV